MKIEVTQEPITALIDYARIPCAFQVQHALDLPESNAPRDRALSVRTVPVPFVKDYDAIPGESPLEWPLRFDMSNWGLFAAHLDGRRIGGAAVAVNAPGMIVLEGRSDLAVLWDIRVSPDMRGRGAGAALFRAAETWSARQGCRQLKAETQDINVPACRFYARQGCELKVVNHSAYPGLPGEVQLFWYKDLLLNAYVSQC